MISLPKSLSVAALNLTLVFLALAGPACSGPAPKQDSPTSFEHSLRADRSEYEKLRDKIPEDMRIENDELALILKLMGPNYKTHPTEVRSKYHDEIRKRSRSFYKKMDKEREDFLKDQRKKKDTFMKELEKEREKFRSKKPEHDALQEFYSDQNSRRREFFEAQRERSDEFMDEHRELRRLFQEKINDHRDLFETEWKEYSKGYYEFMANKGKPPRLERYLQENAPNPATHPGVQPIPPGPGETLKAGQPSEE